MAKIEITTPDVHVLCLAREVSGHATAGGAEFKNVAERGPIAFEDPRDVDVIPQPAEPIVEVTLAVVELTIRRSRQRIRICVQIDLQWLLQPEVVDLEPRVSTQVGPCWRKGPELTGIPVLEGDHVFPD